VWILHEYVIRYDPEADALYIKIRDGKVADSEEISDGIIIDYDEDGNIIGIEVVEFSKKKINLNELVIKGPKLMVTT